MLNPLIEKIGTNGTAVLAVGFFVFVIFSFWYILSPPPAPAVYFLDVGQGDSELIVLPGGVNILVDGGPPNGRALEEIGRILPFTDRYIDLVVMSHPQLDHFGGLIDIMERYRIGTFLYSGRKGEASALAELEEMINEDNIPHVILKKGDRIKYGEYVIEVLSPEKELSDEINDDSLVLKLDMGNSTFLFAGDIGPGAEKKLVESLGDIDVLKVAHHGSKNSSSEEFLNVARPRVSVIEVGENNYGHPDEEVIERLENIGSRIYRTDRDGTVRILPLDGVVNISVGK